MFSHLFSRCLLRSGSAARPRAARSSSSRGRRPRGTFTADDVMPGSTHESLRKNEADKLCAGTPLEGKNEMLSFVTPG